jgi:tellurite resistance-related uncharacterized protein
MERKITGFHLDEENHWVAELDCYHGQHVRHQPPFTSRPWTQTEEGRAAQIGAILNCVRCNNLELPDNVQPYKRTPEFTESTVPAGLLKDHTTKTGAWGVLNVLEGGLIYTVNHPTVRHFEILAGQRAIISPCMLHSVKPHEHVRFYVEFYSLKKAGD